MIPTAATTGHIRCTPAGYYRGAGRSNQMPPRLPPNRACDLAATYRVPGISFRGRDLETGSGPLGRRGLLQRQIHAALALVGLAHWLGRDQEQALGCDLAGSQ